ncbi:MAG: hypothetical protein GY803_20665, partial [Chloroflexi bacterium]|nr:hypothetical protein [Chloroflexota bacterium]
GMAKSISPTRQLIFALLGALVTVALLAVTLWVRLDEGAPALVGFNWQEISIDSDVLGLALQELFVPLVGLYLFSSLPLFERIVTAVSIQNADRIKLTAILILILLLNVTATGLFNEDYDAFVTNGMLVVLAAGLLGGWRTGIVLGAFAMLLYGAYSLLLDFPLAQTEFLSEALSDFPGDLLWNLLDFSVLAMLWGGTVIGFWRDAAGARVWKPSQLFFVGVLFEWFPAWLNFVAVGEGGEVLEHFPAALITGFALMV